MTQTETTKQMEQTNNKNANGGCVDQSSFDNSSFEHGENPILRDVISYLQPIGKTGEKRHLPSTIKLGRDYSTQAHNYERKILNIFDQKPEEERTIIISGVTKEVSETDLNSFLFAIRKILYDQSYTTKNEDVNSGFIREETDRIKPLTVSVSKGKKTIFEERPYYKGTIATSLNDLCKQAYGVEHPTTEQKKRMDKLIRTVHCTPLEITFPNGDVLEAPLCINKGKYTRAEDRATFYILELNEIFCGVQSVKNFAQLPQRANFLLTEAIRTRKQRRKEQHLLLMEFLANQPTSKPFKIGLDNLLIKLKLTEYYAKDCKRIWGTTEADQKNGQLWKIFQIMIDIKQLVDYPKIEYRKSDGMTMFVFTLNPDFSK